MTIRNAVTLCCAAVSVLFATRASAQGSVPKWTLVVAHVIGDDAHETTRFSKIRGLSINAVGDVFVLDDSRTPDIRMFNAKGAFVKRVAREGHVA